MAKLAIVLDKKDTTYEVGEPITGRVEVENDGDCTCNGLTVTAEWFTHGRGNAQQGSGENVQLFTGAWRAGERASYPFRLQG